MAASERDLHQRAREILAREDDERAAFSAASGITPSAVPTFRPAGPTFQSKHPLTADEKAAQLVEDYIFTSARAWKKLYPRSTRVRTPSLEGLEYYARSRRVASPFAEYADPDPSIRHRARLQREQAGELQQFEAAGAIGQGLRHVGRRMERRASRQRAVRSVRRTTLYSRSRHCRAPRRSTRRAARRTTRRAASREGPEPPGAPPGGHRSAPHPRSTRPVRLAPDRPARQLTVAA
jgi:hypothetical protein